MKKVEIIDNSLTVKCNNEHDLFKTCNICNGTGEIKRDRFILISNNMAFDVDQAGK